MKIIALPYHWVDNKKYKDYNNTPWIYLDGELDRINGYDLCYVEEVPTQDGIYDCEVDINGKLYSAKLYYWHSKYSDGQYSPRCIGYVSEINDEFSNAVAQLKYDTKSDFAGISEDDAIILRQKGFTI